MDEQILQVNEAELKVKRTELVSKSGTLAITSADKYELANDILQEANIYIKKVHAKFDTSVDAANVAHKEAVALRASFLRPAEDAKIILSRKMGQYIQLQKEKQLQEEAARLEAARKEQEALNKKAEKAEEKGQVEKASQLRQEADARVLQTESPKVFVPKAEGTRVTEKYRGVVIDKKALIKAIAKGDITDDFLDYNQGNIDKFGQATKGKMPVPGIVWKLETSVAPTGRKNGTKESEQIGNDDF